MSFLTQDPAKPERCLHMYRIAQLKKAPVYKVMLVSKSLQYQGFYCITLGRLKNRKLDNFNNFLDNNGLHFCAPTDNHITKVNMIRLSNLHGVKANQT